MKHFNQWKSRGKKLVALTTACTMAVSLMPAVSLRVEAAEFTGSLTGVTSAAVDSSNKNVVMVTFNDGVKGKITFLEGGIFRYNVDPSGEFSKYAVPRYDGVNGVGRIPSIQMSPAGILILPHRWTTAATRSRSRAGMSPFFLTRRLQK